MRKTAPELKRSRRPSGDRRTFEVAFDKDKNSYERVEVDAYTCCFCGRWMGGVGYAYQRSQIACPAHLDDVRGEDPGPPPSPRPGVPKPAKKGGKRK